MLKESTCSVNLFPAMVNTKKGTLYGYINSTGNFIIKPQYTSAMDFTKSGTAIVSMDDLWGLIDSSATMLLNQYIITLITLKMKLLYLHKMGLLE